MKNFTTYALILAIGMTVFATTARASGDDNTAGNRPVTGMTTGQQEARLREIRTRVEEIRAMDKSSLTKQERKALKNELKGMKREARAISGGIYLSAGAIIIILLVLILIL